jgi:dipeptidyl aminopeptidase/acylaminoacyl peptidase
LLYCQGGPQSPVSQFFSYRWNMQLMAAQGYIVVAPNRRGMPGFGKEWNDQISQDWGGQAMKDLLSAIDSMAKHPYVNKDKLGAVGASYGGYSVFWLAGNHQRRFKAFISHCGVFNLESMVATEELFFYSHEFDGVYWRTPVPASYVKHSPHKYVAGWNTPIMIIANDRDYRVPYSQSLEAYSAARILNIPARFLNFPDEGHWVLKPQNGIMWQREFFDWLNRYLK